MNKASRNTVYRQYIMQALWGMCCDGVGDFTINDLANYCGLKVTSNMRAQLHRAVQDEQLYYDYTTSKRLDGSIHYSFCSQWKELAQCQTQPE